MGYSIFYDRRFVKVGDKIVPIVQTGSNNCWEYSWKGTQIPEKVWSVLNYPKRNQLLFSEKELTEIYQQDFYKEYHHKSRHRCFDDFSRWLINGIKNAKTIEEAIALRNTIVIDFRDESGYHSFVANTEEEFLLLLNKYHDKEVNVGYRERDYNAEKRNVERKEKDLSKGYYVIDVGRKNYLVKMKRHGFYFTSWKSGAKKFLTEAEGKRYMKKYERRLDKEATLTFIQPSPQ